MTFNKLVAVIAISTLAMQANAYSDGSLRRSVTIAQNEVISENQPSQGVVIMNSNTNSNSNSAAAVQQPTLNVEAAPVQESKAEWMRKARQSEEVKTEQRIVEKLEESRLREEQQRAERLFGNKLDQSGAAASATAIATPTGAAASATAIVAEPVPVKEDKPTQVTIEKVEIVQPAPAPVKEEIAEPTPAPVSKMELEEEKEDEGRDKFFVSGNLGTLNYSASNVKSNYGLGVSVGVMLKSNWLLEGSFLYSNHTVDTYWQSPLYSDLDQYDFSAAAKYYVLTGRLKPFVGGSLTYIKRKYQERVQNGAYWFTNNRDVEDETDAVNAGLGLGVDFEVSPNILLGAGVDWNFNVMNKTEFRATYGLPDNFKPLEEIDYTVIKVGAKMTF